MAYVDCVRSRREKVVVFNDWGQDFLRPVVACLAIFLDRLAQMSLGIEPRPAEMSQAPGARPMTISFTPTYEQEKGPEVPDFKLYAGRIMSEFAELLADDPTENAVQHFLEQNPCMVPGAWTPGSPSGHGPLYGALITQPPLHGFHSRIPDFMWLSTHSGAWYPAMIEIERPSKRVFTNAGIPSADFSQARNQFNQWKTWLDEPANVQLLIDQYGVASAIRSFRPMELHFILVFGRRAEFESSAQLSKQRGKLLSLPEELLSFDRLDADPKLRNAVTVKAIGGGRFEVVAVPETFSLSPSNAADLLVFDGLVDAIRLNSRISKERANFLEKRIEYWKHWAQYGRNCVRGREFDE
jgi:hypothetical protein